MNKKTIGIIIGIIVIAALGFWLFGDSTPENEKTEIIDITQWQTYANEDYHFTLLYPQDWQIAEMDDGKGNVRFSVYKPEVNSTEPAPFPVGSNTTHVTVYPAGANTDALFGQFDASSAQFALPMEKRIDYMLRSAKPFATYAQPQTAPDSWSEDGFILARLHVQDQVITCVGGSEQGSEKPQEQCDPNTDEMIRSGQVNQQDRNIQTLILNNFHFTQ